MLEILLDFRMKEVFIITMLYDNPVKERKARMGCFNGYQQVINLIPATYFTSQFFSPNLSLYYKSVLSRYIVASNSKAPKSVLIDRDV